MSNRILATYGETCNLIRHYDTLKYTCWTLFTAIIAGLYVAKSSSELTSENFVILVGLSSLYFCFLLTRIQRNYKIYCSIAEKLEDVLRLDEISERKGQLPEDFRIGPFDMANSVLPGNFNEISSFEKIFGGIPYFMLHIIFFAGVFVVFLAIYFISPASKPMPASTTANAPASKPLPTPTKTPTRPR